MRVDKWLHHVRLFKTRSLAGQACGKGNITLLKQAVKASREVTAGDIVEVGRNGIVMRVRVLGVPQQRLGASRVAEFMEDLTPPEVYAKAESIRREDALTKPSVHEQAGRPNKQQMRELRRWREAAGE